MRTFASRVSGGDLRIEGEAGQLVIVSSVGSQSRIWGRFHDRQDAEMALEARGAFLRACHSRWAAEVEVHQRIAAELLAA